MRVKSNYVMQNLFFYDLWGIFQGKNDYVCVGKVEDLHGFLHYTNHDNIMILPLVSHSLNRKLSLWEEWKIILNEAEHLTMSCDVEGGIKK